jgi:hypothetical protein
VFKLFVHISLKIAACLKSLHVEKVYKTVRTAIQHAESMFASAQKVKLIIVDNNGKDAPQRTLCS